MTDTTNPPRELCPDCGRPRAVTVIFGEMGVCYGGRSCINWLSSELEGARVAAAEDRETIARLRSDVTRLESELAAIDQQLRFTAFGNGTPLEEICRLQEQVIEHQGAIEAAFGIVTANPRKSLLGYATGVEAHHQEHHRREARLESELAAERGKVARVQRLAREARVSAYSAVQQMCDLLDEIVGDDADQKAGG